ncbi:MAG TPA: YitT family protein [Candidatus Merdiplasma excrementigallinarum]|uniref:YitT family protein n=1 Tax=Candidatus Merdiplasma excrementigallinarum TaxID=2840864 RepID=A0A9D1P0W0_9FIRM|nr:YitT family protein [Candidatus Merdiplasma excrementigallinarum]
MIKKKKTLLIDLLCDLAGGILYAMGIYTFAKMADFAPGGLSGLALISNYLWGLPIGLMTLILNVPLVIVSYKVVGKQFLLKTARSMVISTIILDLIFPLTPPYTGSPFMAALYSGLCMGAGMAFFYMRGSSSGGMDFLIMTIKVRHPHFSLGMVTMVTDFLIILLGWPVFGNIDAVLYGLATAFVSTIVLDKILYGVGAGKLIIIITNEGQQLADRIGEMTDRGSTIIRARGTYTQADRQVLLCACSKSQTYSITAAAHQVDPGAFIMVTETSEVYGEGFIEKK